MGNGMNKILPSLYLGSLVDSKDWTQLRRNGITHIISVLGKPQPLLQEFTYLCIPLPDSPEISIQKHFKECVTFIHFCRMKGGNCLVHCLAGISRSPTIVAAYIMTVTGLGSQQVLDAVKVLRPGINPNEGFRRQLEDYGHRAAKEVARHLRERYGDNPFDDKKDIMALLLPKETQSTEGTGTALHEKVHEPRHNEAAGSKLHGHEVTAERESDFQEPELRTQGAAGTRTDQQEPEDAEGRANNMQESRQATGDTTSTNLQELLHRREDSMRTSVKGTRQLTGTGDALQDPVCRCEEGAGRYPQTPVRRAVDMEGQVHRSRQTSQEPMQGGHRNSHSTVLRMKQGCFCIPSCLK
ncbi:dual specificity protein phosphatase 15 [Lissotriton helveticus]